MERQEDTHLTADELDAVLEVPFDREGFGPEAEIDVAKARRHLDQCAACRSKVEMHAAAQRRLELLRTAEPAGRGPHCPPESEWAWIAAGLKEGQRAETLVRHAAECDYCGPRLRQAIADFTQEVKPEEEAALEGIESQREGWQIRVADKLSEQSRALIWIKWLQDHLPSVRMSPGWAYACGIALLAAISFWAVPSLWRPSIDTLLARAYTEQRTFDLRLPNAAHAPVRLLRGSDRSRFDRPPALLASEARIAAGLAKNPSSPALLQAKGRAELLEWNYADATASLERALALQPDSTSLLTDLASAYYEQAEAEHNAAGYSRAVELLGKVLKAAPDHPVALFNRAIVYERMRLYPQAAEDWRHYLRVDPNADWAGEARQRLAGLGTGRDSDR